MTATRARKKKRLDRDRLVSLAALPVTTESTCLAYGKEGILFEKPLD